MVFRVIKEVRDIKRFEKIVLVLFEEGFGYLLSKIKLKRLVPFKHRIRKKRKEESPETRLRKTLERLGPTFIKLGQILSVRPDLIPKSYIKELEKLQDDVPEFDFEDAKKIIEKELKQPMHKIFSSFEKKPIASASISQVYKATLKNGDKAAVKVQRPDVRKLMETDIDILFYIAHLLEKHIPELKKYDPVGVIREFSIWTEKELDFRIEARNAHLFAHNFKDSKTVKIPKVYDKYSTSSILTLEFIDAVEIHNIKDIQKRKLDMNRIIQNGFDAILTQVFVHGFFHADPHPGNILVLNNDKIAFVDFGIVGYFDEQLKHNSVDLFYAIVDQDAEKTAEMLLQLGNVRKDSININEFREEVRETISMLEGSEIKKVKISRVLEDLMDISLHHKVKMPLSFVLFGKTIVTLEGISLEYAPDFNFMENVQPFVRGIILKRTNPLYIFHNLIESISKIRRISSKVPEKVDKVLDTLEKGTIKIDIEDTDINRLSLEIDRSSNRLAYGMIIAALLVAGALVIQVGQRVVIGMPIISFIFFVLAAIIGLVLLTSIIREKVLQ